jgi:subtilisin family serine protease
MRLKINEYLIVLRFGLLVGSVFFSLPMATASTGPTPQALGLAGPEVRISATPVPGEYVVLFNEQSIARTAQAGKSWDSAVATLRDALVAEHAGDILVTWNHAVRGMAIRMSARDAEDLALDPRVALVEENGLFSLSSSQTPATWGLDRVDQRDLPLNNSYVYNSTGKGVTAYIIDSGIYTGHLEFRGRASWGANFTGDGINRDCHGHGTHVAGTVGGATYGVAKEVALIGLKAFDCLGFGSTDSIISAIDWIFAHQQSPAVVNMSFGGAVSGALDLAVVRLVDAGITVLAAAGNNNADACASSPAGVEQAITIGATRRDDTRAVFSNWGTCLDIFAPGVDITSAAIQSMTATAIKSGTSMAAPHVTGAAALYLEDNPAASPADVALALWTLASLDRVMDPGTGSPNNLLYTGLAENSFSLGVTLSGDGGGSVVSSPAGVDCGQVCQGEFPGGTLVTLTPIPDANSLFAGWGGDPGCSTGKMVLDGDLLCSAAFQPKAMNATYVGLYAKPTGYFLLRGIHAGGNPDFSYGFGPVGLGWIPLAGDWDGDGIATVGLYDPAASTFFLRNLHAPGVADILIAYGPPNSQWIPLSGDWDGDGITTVGLYDPQSSIFYLQNSHQGGTADVVFPFGPPHSGWVPLAGDWDGDGLMTVGLYDPKGGIFFLRNINRAGNADHMFSFGPANSQWYPLAGDWNGDGRTSIGLFEPTNSAFFLRDELAGGQADLSYSFVVNGPASIPIAGDWN